MSAYSDRKDKREILRLVFLGTGTPIPDAERVGSGVAVVSDEEILMIDCGPGTTFRFIQAGLTFRKVSHLFLTHHHFDHTISYAHLALESWITGRKQPLRVYGPLGTTRMSRLFFNEVYAEEISSRTSLGGQGPLGADSANQSPHHGAPVRSGLESLQVVATDIDEGFRLQTDNWQIKAFRVEHACPPYALGYRLEWGNKIIVFSGDTSPCANLTEAASGADILVHEAFWPKAEKAWKTLLAQATAYEWARRWGHTTPDEVGKLAQQTRVKKLVLTHLTPYEDEATLVSMVRRHYSGEVVVARDLMVIE